jgi:prephenate dehydratase
VDIKFDDYVRYEQALAAVRPLMEDLNILGEYKAAI